MKIFKKKEISTRCKVCDKNLASDNNKGICRNCFLNRSDNKLISGGFGVIFMSAGAVYKIFRKR